MGTARQDSAEFEPNAVPRKIRWGVLGVAKIALERVIPATQATAQAEAPS